MYSVIQSIHSGDIKITVLTRGTQILGARSSWWPNFEWWHL